MLVTRQLLCREALALSRGGLPMSWDKRAALIVSSVVLVGLSGGWSSAQAKTTSTFSDRHHDARPGLDIQLVHVDNGTRIAVTVTFGDLKRTDAGGLGVYFDTRGPDPGPEYVVGGGLGEGTDYDAFRIENWQGDHAQRLIHCDVRMTVRYVADTATFSLARGCLRHPGRIRVAAVTNGARDWAPSRHHFYGWVRH
jgi:hypothetical protein